MSTTAFSHPIDTWIAALEQYDLIQLCTKLSPHSWSLGQLYMHLLRETNFYLEQIKICISTDENLTEEASANAKNMLFHNAFPDEIITGPPTNLYIPQPDSKEQLRRDLMNLKNEIHSAAMLIETSLCQGKTQHPGLHYFDAREWYQFAAMHLRHHWRQKERIDVLLNNRT